ncbi:SgrR family transcriptional regulator [Vibrio sp. NTOU-M3]|uniref:SgrR family transcriptional regulator n=1 Tax=Vibrio sp. NTOU-M3 TaxID=3234954 RepID=UPI00349F7D79
MSDLKLLRYYARLTPLGVDQEIKTALSALAETLFTSPRHARNLLHEMQQLNWLSWQPKVGRNQRSTLVLHVELARLKEQLASERIRAGQYEKALTLLDQDKRIFGRLLQSTSGASIREGQLHIQLTYKRPFERLVPHLWHRSSERYLLRQVYCCLISCNEQGQLQPELAHHWFYDNENWQWSFYLRPGLTFHDGTLIDAQSIVALFNKLKDLPNYCDELAHLASISAPSPNQVVFHLSMPDKGFGGLLTSVKYSIQPSTQVVEQNSDHNVIGSGVFEVIEHSEARLCLQAFERYYACRALTDKVTIWHLQQPDSLSKKIETNHPHGQPSNECNYYLSQSGGDNPNSAIQQCRVEEGCLFALFNQSKTNALTASQRHSMTQLLSPSNVRVLLTKQQNLFSCVDANNLLPGWSPIRMPDIEPVPLPAELSIAVYDYSALVHCATAIQALLQGLGVSVAIHNYSYRELTELARNGELEQDLVITNINLDDTRQASAFNSLYNNPVLHHCIGASAHQWLRKSLEQLRSTTELEQYLDTLEPIATAMVSHHWLIPLFHHRQTLRFHDVLKDVALTNWGWPDIRNVWSTD